MALVCPHCAAANRPNSRWCAFCRAPLHPDSSEEAASAVRVSVGAATGEEEAAAEAVPSSDPQWRLEVSQRVEAYLVRTGQRPAGEPQRDLPFPEAESAPATPAVVPAKPRPKPRRTERLEIFVDQPELDFSSGAASAPNHALVPVASLTRRAYAWILDMALLGVCWGMFLGLLRAFGIELAASKLAIAICLAILVLLYAQYFALFTAFGGTTPGMWIAGLHVVSFDGNTPTPQQLLWRSLGYLVSAGAFLLGFFWALWDEDRLCWQDRASQTYLTSVNSLSEHRQAEAHR